MCSGARWGGFVTDAAFWEAVDDARKLVASWPAWKRGILEASGSPTCERREVVQKENRMADSKFSKLEAAAIVKKKSQFVESIKAVLTPVIRNHLGLNDTEASRVAYELAAKHKQHLEDAAISELQDRFGYLVELMEGQSNGE